ncbi:MAG: thioredoxin [Tannerellaceae bacterium]|nr:thioredoxin [Tannerellaceae bacterium]
MKKLKGLLVLSVMFSLISCSMSAKDNNPTADSNVAKGEVIVLDKADFIAKVFDYESNIDNWVYEGDKPCIVDFYADWCGPCKKISPILKDLAILYKDDIVVYKINVDNEKELAAAFGIQSIPTLLFIPKEGIPQIAQGALPREEFVKQIDSYLLGKK